MIDEKPIRTRYQAVRRSLDERGRRLHAAAEALTAGHGGVAATRAARSPASRGFLKPIAAGASDRPSSPVRATAADRRAMSDPWQLSPAGRRLSGAPCRTMNQALSGP